MTSEVPDPTAIPTLVRAVLMVDGWHNVREESFHASESAFSFIDAARGQLIIAADENLIAIAIDQQPPPEQAGWAQ